MTTVYLIRHAEADTSVQDQKSRPLTKKGLQDCERLAETFADINIDLIISSPYKRAVDSVKLIAERHGLVVVTSENFRGLKLQSSWIDSYRSFFIKYWNDFNYHYKDGESFARLQARCVDALEKALAENKGKTILIGSHSVLLAVIMKHYDSSFGFEDFMQIAQTEPFITKIIFDDNGKVVSTGLNSLA